MKRKVWDITVKDNPNRVVMGENDEFYTTDTEAYLVFNLEDKNFNPATAVLTLENRNDGSLKNETVDVVDGLIEWEMPQRYIEHFGNWQGQLVYEDTKDGQPELYTSAPFSFVVNAHIGDKKKPSLVEIENWEKFIRDGTELIETWEDMEDLRQANEAQRQANYQELLDTGVLQTNINNKLEQLEEEYAPKLTEVTAQLAQTGVNVKTYGAKGDGVTDDVDAIQAAIADLPKDGGVLYFPPGVYIQGDGTNPHYQLDEDDWYVMEQDQFIGKDNRFTFKNFKNLTIWGYGATIKAHPDNSTIVHNGGFRFEGGEDVKVYGLTYDGSIASRKPVGGDRYKFNQQDGFRVMYDFDEHKWARRFHFVDVAVHGSVMDGFMFDTRVEDITLDNCKGWHCYRQGASVVDARQVKFYNCDFSYTGTIYGTMPMTGIDYEADDYDLRSNDRGVVSGCNFEGNMGEGVILHYGTFSALIENNLFTDNNLVIARDPMYLTSNTSVVNNKFNNSKIETHGGGEYIAQNTFQISKETPALEIGDDNEVYKTGKSRKTIIENNNIVVDLPSPETIQPHTYYGSVILRKGNIIYRNNVHLNVNGGNDSLYISGNDIELDNNIFKFDDSRYSKTGNLAGINRLKSFKNNVLDPIYQGRHNKENVKAHVDNGFLSKSYNTPWISPGQAIDIVLPIDVTFVEITMSGFWHDSPNFGVRKELFIGQTLEKRKLLNVSENLVTNGFKVSDAHVKDGRRHITLYAQTETNSAVIKVKALMPGSHSMNDIRKNFYMSSLYNYSSVPSLNFRNIYSTGLNWSGSDDDIPNSTNGFSEIELGACYFNTTLKQPIWYNGTDWVDSTGAII